ncbi:hypothetical protein [Novosphingobium sp. TH158]|uniref:hypothetical protein n=1 Tax=Novosphingobium sp. TH158 TaxID=2067455 RepID=UPI0011817DB1|nr:hypothetical protein [Novosphingobium sp. TH158]
MADPIAMESAGLAGDLPGAEAEWPQADAGPLLSIVGAVGRDVARQVSIEQRLIIRIAPQAPSPQQRATILSDLPRKSASPKVEERSMGKCVPVAGIAGVQIAPQNRLLLFMRDTRVVSAALDKGCTARDFYSGFYVARTADGQMCSGRDKLQSRNGANCKLGKLKQLVQTGN